MDNEKAYVKQLKALKDMKRYYYKIKTVQKSFGQITAAFFQNITGCIDWVGLGEKRSLQFRYRW